MGTPFKSAEDAGARTVLQTSMNEVVSALSALNMHPSPKEPGPHSNGYLSETDDWAAHSMEHLRNVLEEMRKLDLQLGRVVDAVFRATKNNASVEEVFHKVMDIVNGEED